jgi:hypothetical protein
MWFELPQAVTPSDEKPEAVRCSWCGAVVEPNQHATRGVHRFCSKKHRADWHNLQVKRSKEHSTGRLLGHHGDGDKADETINAGHRE